MRRDARYLNTNLANRVIAEMWSDAPCLRYVCGCGGCGGAAASGQAPRPGQHDWRASAARRGDSTWMGGHFRLPPEMLRDRDPDTDQVTAVGLRQGDSA